MEVALLTITTILLVVQSSEGKAFTSSINCAQYSSDIEVLHSLPFSITIANRTTQCTPAGPCARIDTQEHVVSFEVWNNGPEEALQVYCLTHLRQLSLRLNRPQWHVPQELGDLSQLMELVLVNIADGNDLPGTIGKLKNLEWLILNGNRQLVELPDSLGECKTLKFLDVQAPLKHLPASISFLPLKNLWLSSLAATSLPVDFFKNLNPTLKSLIINISKLDSFDSFSELTNLLFLEVYTTGLAEIPAPLSTLTALRDFRVSGQNHLTSLPQNFPENLATLVLQNNYFTKIPKQVLLSENLQALDFSDNRLTDISEITLAKGPLKDLRLARNRIETVPNDLTKLTDSLQQLFLSGNKLKTVPAEELVKMRKLTYLDISDNLITAEERARLRVVFATNPNIHVQF